MREELIKFDTAKLAKEKGFNELINSYYKETDSKVFFHKRRNTHHKKELYALRNNDMLPTKNGKDRYSVPTQSLLQKWLREKHNIQIEINMGVKYIEDSLINLYSYSTFERSPQLKINWKFSSKKYETYEEALEIGLQEGLKLIKL